MVRMYTLLISRVLVVIACLILITSAQSYKPDSFTDYQNARDCVKGCVYSGLVDQAPLNLGCNQQNPVTCQCGSIGDVSNSLSRWIWTCASTGCGDDPEASSAVAIFHEYCVANLSPTAQPTSSSSSPAVTAGPTPGGTTG
jgi:hypothetical protein